MAEATESPSAAASEAAPSRWGAFSHAAFVVIWTASVVSNVGTAMFDTASGWLMTSLSASPLAVSLVQVAVSLPLFLFTLPAGALADVIDSRRLLVVVEFAIIVISAILAVLVSLGLASPAALLISTFLLGVGGALSAPAWQAITPLLVPRQDLDGAVSANSVGFNLSRAVGPALGGIAIAALGIAIPFWVFCASNFGIIAALLWWRSPRKAADSLPAERLTSAVRAGVRYAANNQYLRATLVRAFAFFPFATAYWALLPLVARSLTSQGPQLYGILLGAIGVGAIAGSFALNWLKEKLGPNRVVAFGTLATAFALVLFGLAHDPAEAIVACLIAGASWTIVLTLLYVSAQVALPDWVRGRGLAIFLTAIFGATTIGSAVWGQLAGMEGLAIAHFVAAAGVVIAIPLTWGWRLQTGANLDLTPSMHWRAPVLAQKIENNRGPVLVSVQYRVNAENRAEFLSALSEVGHERKRDGAFAWGLFEDAADTGRFVESFLIESWLELMHARERVTNADRVIEDHVRQLLAAEPQVTFLIASPRAHRSHWKRKPPAT
ncbi:MFS transporter [Methylocapsa sp. S129]|uniref:MFS transporter n=1 Tax=Methylocapsa sp. S129 TaxID=1641869 RepID=UPI00131EB7AE|nr:MFS transporter [Methylocapsa sp. S129]